MRTLRLIVLILTCYLAGTITAELLLPRMCAAPPAVSAGDVAHLGTARTSVQSFHSGSREAASEL
ncbi:MAG: hypothetical protein ACYC3X_18185 [Pirellulaceae bacterium]